MFIFKFVNVAGVGQLGHVKSAIRRMLGIS